MMCFKAVYFFHSSLKYIHVPTIVWWLLQTPVDQVNKVWTRLVSMDGFTSITFIPKARLSWAKIGVIWWTWWAGMANPFYIKEHAWGHPTLLHALSWMFVCIQATLVTLNDSPFDVSRRDSLTGCIYHDHLFPFLSLVLVPVLGIVESKMGIMSVPHLPDTGELFLQHCVNHTKAML